MIAEQGSERVCSKELRVRRATVVLVLLWAAAACCAGEEAVSYRLASRGGRLAIAGSDGRVLPWACYSLSIDLSVKDWEAKQGDLIAAGVHVFQVTPHAIGGQLWSNAFSSMDGKPLREPRVPVDLEQKVKWLLAHDPQAHIIVRFSFVPDMGWRKQHLDQYQPFASTRGPLRDGFSVKPSLASQAYHDHADRVVRDTIAWCERMPWRNRIIGYSLFPYGEGATEIGIWGEGFDTSPVMNEAFRAWGRRKYGSDAALQKAWDDKTATLATVKVPTKAEWLAKRDRLKILHWPEPAKVQRERDYFLLQKELFHRFWGRLLTAMQEATAARPVLKGCDSFKQHMQGWLLTPDFDSAWTPGVLDDYISILLASGSIGVGPLLDGPGLDMLQTPGMYFNWAMGYAWEAEGLSDSLVLRGKLNYMEADMRTWVRKTWRGKPMKEGEQIKDAGAFMTPAEMRAGFDRTLAWALSRNQMFYYTSVCGANWWYHDPAIGEKIKEEVGVIAGSVRRPWANTSG